VSYDSILPHDALIWVQRHALQKGTAWGRRGCGHIPNDEKLANIRAKILNNWANYAASFTYK